MLSETFASVTQEESERLKAVSRNAAEFIANFEIAEQKMQEWEQRLYLQEERVQMQINAVHAAVSELQSIMTEAGAARWRIAAEQSLMQGQEHLLALKAMSEEHLQRQRELNQKFMLIAKKTFERLDRASEHAMSKITKIIEGFNPQVMKEIAEKHCDVLETTSTSAIKKIHKFHQNFHWKGIAFAASIAIMASVLFGLYANDQLPWEMHQQVALQRNAGEALIKAWPTLSDAEKEHILQNSETAFT